MDTFISFLAIAVGFLLRLAIPIAGTAILIYLMRRLDERWQAEAENTSARTEKAEYWDVKECPVAQKATYAEDTTPLPCWQAFRLPNGYLQEKCLTCKVFINAPVPALQTEPRRM